MATPQAGKGIVKGRGKGGILYDFDFEPEVPESKVWPPQEEPAPAPPPKKGVPPPPKAHPKAKSWPSLRKIPPPEPAYQLHEPWAVPLRARAQAEYRPGSEESRAWGHRPAMQRFSGEIGNYDLSALRAAEVQGYFAYEEESLSEAESQDSQESLSGNVNSRWDPTRTERRYAYGTDPCVQFSRVRHIEWNRVEWREKLLKANHLGARTPVEKMKAAVCKVMAMNRGYKGITAPAAEWQIEVERQKAGRLAQELQRIRAEKARVEREKKKSKLGRKEARAKTRGERQAKIEKELMQQNTEAQNLVEHMEEALLKVPELRPPAVPDLHPNELLQAKLVIHDLATSDLGMKVSELKNTSTHRGSVSPQKKVQNWDQKALSNWLNQAHSEAEKSVGPTRSFYPEPTKGLLLQPVVPLDNLKNQPWYPRNEPQIQEPEPEERPKDDKVWL